MNLTYTERNELNELSLYVFGSSSRWQKLVNRGYAKTLTETTEEMVPGKDGAPDEVKEIQVPVRYGNSNTTVSVVTRYTLEGIKTRMLELKKFKDELIAAENERKAAAAQKALEDQVNKELMGSAV